MKKIRLTTIFLALMFYVLPILSILMMHNVMLSDTISKMGRGSFGNSYSYISIKNADNSKAELISIMNEQKVRYTLFSDEELDDGSVVRHIYFNKKYVNFPMESGRFFKTSDFGINNNVAVVGKLLKNQIYTRKGRDYISIDNKEYSVLGVIGYKKQTQIDNYIFINMLSESEIKSQLFMVDYLTNVDAEETSQQFIAKLTTNNMEAELLSGGENYSESLMPKIAAMTWFVALLVSVVICLALVSSQWIIYQKREIGIRRLLGASISNIFVYVLRKYICIAVSSFVVGAIYCNVLYPAYFGFLLSGYSICMLVMSLFACTLLLCAIQEPIEEVVK